MSERITRVEAVKSIDLPVTNAVDFKKGEMACFDTATGLVTVGAVSATLKPIGHFRTNGTGDGTTLHTIRLFKELRLHWWDNAASPNDVGASDRGNDCYIDGVQSVTTLATGRSVAGEVWAVNTRYGVLVRMRDF